MRLILHSGTHKTATTSFQRVCIKYKELLLKDLIYYPSLRSLSENRYLLGAFKDNVMNLVHFNNHSPLAWLIQQNEFDSLEKYFKFIFNEAKELKYKNVLISGEDFENLLIDQNLAKKLLNILREIGFSDVEWIFVKRDPYTYLNSIYSELSKHRLILNFQKLYEEAYEKGYITVSSNIYTWKFVFDFEKFVNEFDNYLGGKAICFSFNEFKKVFAGKILLSRYLSDESIDYLVENSYSFDHANKSLDPLNVEFRYVCNFLGISASQENYNQNKKLFDSLILSRRNTISFFEDKNKNKFNERFKLNHSS